MPKQALIMIDMQRGFLDSASPLCIPAAEETVPACAALIGRCHEAGVPVIYAVRHYRADGTDVEKPRAAAWAAGGKPLSEDCAAHRFKIRIEYVSAVCGVDVVIIHSSFRFSPATN